MKDARALISEYLHSLLDLHLAGGIPAELLTDAVKLHKEALDALGQPAGESVEEQVSRFLENAPARTGGAGETPLNAPRPFKIGDTVLVPKGAMVYTGNGGTDFPSQINEFTPCEAVITDPDDDGNLRLKYNGEDKYLVRPDQVTRVPS